MPKCCIDHIIVTAPSLDVGAEHVRQALGVAPQTGGGHPRMGTHNLLLRLGDSVFLEVISVNPNVPAPTRPRWFALDTLRPNSMPRLSAWVVRSSDIHATAAASSEALGNIEPMSRGVFDWHITIPADGLPPLNGAAPALIEWHSAEHPAANLEDHGLSLLRLELRHPEAVRVSRLLQSIGFADAVAVLPLGCADEVRMVAHINTPLGVRVL